MTSKTVRVILLLLCACVMSVGVVGAQGGGNGNGGGRGGGGSGGGGGGRPELPLAYVVGVLKFMPESQDEFGVTIEAHWELWENVQVGEETLIRKWTVDFGPEWYDANACLQNIFNQYYDGDNVAIALTNNREIGEFKCNEFSGNTCVKSRARGFSLRNEYPSIWPYRAFASRLATTEIRENTAIWGRIEAGKPMIRAWEISYDTVDGEWFFWRNEADPWQQRLNLSCPVVPGD